ncbi:MAG: hypothetical protein H7315_02495, partial [Herminiimonas sp.]|nr:hypothetical protein [Herminiimonas sp.]
AMARQAAHAGGDNLSIAGLEAELHGIDVTTIPMSLGEIDRERDLLLQQLNALSADHANALQALAQVAGSDDAARAESQRQRALARMANAAERYAKVHTAARLLRWAIDRYRQTRQGPMLEAASTIFSSLTLGNFKRLVVDFDSQPLALEAQRSDASMVGIAGLSDGTRDQLYLALRLAALELHLEQSQSLPFLADDLFINFDDARSRAGLEALAHLSTRTQVIFLSHHDHLVPTVQAVFGQHVNVIYL